MANQEIPTLQFVEDLQGPIVQAAPNVNQGYYDWGSNYSKVINVGAWNKASNQELLLSSPTTIDTIDIVADGYVIKNEWGANFGTSFATPRVTAEIVNVIINMTLANIIACLFSFIFLILQNHQMHYQTLLINAHNHLPSFHL